MVSSETLYAQLRDAVFDNDKERLQELLQTDGVDVDHFDAGGQTLLHLACFWGRMDLVKVLLNAGASLKTKNAASCTALDLATHWGHSAVAEVIRLRGGRSVWEEKLGHLQVEAEDLRLQAQQSRTQYLAKKRDVEALTADYHALYARFEEAKSARVLAERALAKAQGEVEGLATEVARLQAALEVMTANFHASLIEKAKAQHLQQESQRETTAVIAHRDDILRVMQESVAKQEQAAHGWQRAEVAAAIAESQRNFAFADRDRFQKKHVAALAELVVVTAKLDAAEEELMTLKTDLAEHIYEKRREKKLKKRAERALGHVFGEAGGSDAGGGGRKSGAPAPLATPKSSQQLRSVSPPPLPRQQQQRETEKRPTTNARVPLAPTSSTPVTGGSSGKKKYFSLAAREFGERLRAEEIRKQKDRAKRHARTENQYLTQGLSAPLRASEQFQDEFVAKVQNFSAARSAKWKELKKDRDRQAWFTRSVLARPIATAPHSLGSGGDGSLLEGDSEEPDGKGVLPTTASTDAGSSTTKTKRDGTVHFGLYSKYARPVALDNPLRPVTSPLELRMQRSFFSAPPREGDDLNSGDEGDGGTDSTGDKESSSALLTTSRGGRGRMEEQRQDAPPLAASVSAAAAFLPAVSR
ncbi:hypothetical protein PybrP1_001684 [[Pythium] brassicae (nom. inval.)]|nr:hypothetical protein PybrP1_001684 [[Pythium] brassicae (nom. inval.)]